MVDKEQIEKLRKTMVEILDEIHRVCEENDITYYIVSGTALGAVRHSGFIPWDSDIDVAMIRQDYDRFISIANKHFHSGFECDYFGNQTEWYHPHALVFKTNTQIHWNRDYYINKIDCPVYVDIFPLDKFPDDIKQRNAFEKKMNRMQYVLSRQECILYQHNNMIEKILKKVTAKILHIIYPGTSFNRRLDQQMSKYKNENFRTFGIIPSRYGFKREGITWDIVGKPCLYRFEGKMYYSYEKMDEYLRNLYGNYMEYPPIEKRKENFDYIDRIEFNL